MAIYEDAYVPDNVKLYDFEDFDTHRDLIFNDAKEALENQFPKEHNGVRMELLDLKYTDKDKYSIKEQKNALHNDLYLMRRLRGKIRLTDSNTGEVLDEKDMTLMRVPWLTPRGTFIRGGNEWASISQQRMLPGAYTRVQKNGNLETQFNVRPGTGNAFRVQFNPETTQYKFSIGGSELHLYSVLHDLGVSDDVMRNSWGDDVFMANAKNYDKRVLDKAYNKIVPEWDRKKNPSRSEDDKKELIRNALNRSQIATNVVKKTLPNLFDLKKSAQWKEGGEMMEKCASMTKDDIAEISTYINAVSGTKIDVDAPKDEQINQIKNVVKTGYENGSLVSNKVDYNNPGVMAVRQLATTKAIDFIKRKVEEHKQKYPVGKGF